MSKRVLVSIISLVCTLLLGITSVTAQSHKPDDVRNAAAKSIALLQRVGLDWFDKQTCTSCHQQDLPMMVYRLARERGLALNDDVYRRTVSKAYGFLNSLDRAVQNPYLIDPSMDYGMRLVSAHDAGVPASASTGAYVRLIANRQQPNGSWITIDVRPPQSHSVFTATAIATRAVQLDAPAQLKGEMRARVDRARQWLTANKPMTTEDRVFQLRGLAWSGAEESRLRELARRLIADQRPDGGWSQLSTLASDAYATGEVLFALHDGGKVPVSDPAWQKGLQYLLSTQRPDGSWLVKSRLNEQNLVSPPHFDSGFPPHDTNQMISCMGTAWATAALLMSMEPAGKTAVAPIDVAAVTPVVKSWMDTALFGTMAELKSLLDSGLDPNSKTSEGTTLLMMAAPDPAKVRLLLERGAAVNATASTGFTALMVAANYRNAIESVRLLLDKGAVVNAPKDKSPTFNASPLFYGVFSGDLKIVDLLVSKGADLQHKMLVLGMAPNRPIDFAVAQHDIPMIRYLAQKGISVNAEDPDIPAALVTYAILSNDTAMTKTLIDLGADLNKIDSLGLTPLMHAASVYFGDTEMIQLLLKSGARTSVRSKSGQTAKQLAETYGHQEIVRLISQ